MKKTITIEIESFKSNILNSLKEEIAQDKVEKNCIIKNNDIILRKLNEVLNELKLFLSESLGDLPISIDAFQTAGNIGFVGIKSKKVKCNYASRNATFGFTILPKSEYSHKHQTHILNGKFKLSIVTKYEDTEITMDKINLIFEKGKGTLKDMMLADFDFA